MCSQDTYVGYMVLFHDNGERESVAQHLVHLIPLKFTCELFIFFWLLGLSNTKVEHRTPALNFIYIQVSEFRSNSYFLSFDN